VALARIDEHPQAGRLHAHAVPNGKLVAINLASFQTDDQRMTSCVTLRTFALPDLSVTAATSDLPGSHNDNAPIQQRRTSDPAPELSFPEPESPQLENGGRKQSMRAQNA
jgi:hypothetical protein